MISGKLFPAHPHPKKGEIFSSWVTRIAQANGNKLHTVGLRIWDRYHAYSFWAHDMDNSASKEVVAAVCRKTGVDFERGWETTLSFYEGILFEQHQQKGVTRWILPAKAFHRTRRGHGMVFCPLCLREDEEPYFRRSWRLSFNTVCEKHGTMMLDGCPKCTASIAYFRRDIGHRERFAADSIVKCHQCDFDLRFCTVREAPTPDGQTLTNYRALIAHHDLGWWFIGSKVLNYSKAYFDVLHHLASFLTSKMGGRLLKTTEAEFGCRKFSKRKFERMRFEKRPLKERHWLLLIAFWLLLEWPDRFIRICRKAPLTSSRIMRSETFPFWFQSIADEYLSVGHL